jgi:hypothetical protein
MVVVCSTSILASSVVVATAALVLDSCLGVQISDSSALLVAADKQ